MLKKTTTQETRRHCLSASDKHDSGSIISAFLQWLLAPEKGDVSGPSCKQKLKVINKK